jgi:hypothetical protein
MDCVQSAAVAGLSRGEYYHQMTAGSAPTPLATAPDADSRAHRCPPAWRTAPRPWLTCVIGAWRNRRSTARAALTSTVLLDLNCLKF